MRPRRTLLALAVLAVLAGIIYLEYRTETGEGARAADLVLHPGAGAVLGLDLRRPGETVSVRRKGEEWVMTSPARVRADGEAVEGAVATLRRLEVTGRVAPGEDGLAAYGLEPPELEIGVHLEGSPEPVSLQVGARVPVGTGRYARRDGEAGILIVASPVESLLAKDAGSLRYRKVVGMEPWEVDRIAVERGGRRVAVERHGSGWRLLAPEAIPAVGTAVNTRLLEISALRADGFAPEGSGPGDLGLDSPEIILELGGRGGRESTVRLSRAGEGGGWWAVRDDMEEIFSLPAAAGKTLRLDPAELRDPRIAPVDGQTITGIKAGMAGREITLVRDEDAVWRWESSTGLPASAGEVDHLIDALSSARARTLVPPGRERSSRDGPVRLDLSLEAAGIGPLRLQLRGCDGDDCTVSSSATDHLYILPAPLAHRLEESVREIHPPEAAEAGRQGPDGGEPAS